MKNKTALYGGLVWLLAGIGLTTYGIVGLSGLAVPGVEQLVGFISGIEGRYIYAAAFLAILIEGLYFIGSFFPGTTLIIVVAVLSQAQSWFTFALTILSIFLGWCVAGIINITMASKLASHQAPEPVEVKDRLFITWFPAFRANYEVSQVVAGADPYKVFLSSVRVRAWASLAAAVGVAILPLIVDVTEMKNEEGFASLFVIAAIMLGTGTWQIRSYRRNR